MEEQLPWFTMVLNFDLCPLPKTVVPICMLLVLFLDPILSSSDVTHGNSSKIFAHSSSKSKSKTSLL